MIPRHEGPYRPFEESIAACEAHRDALRAGYEQALTEGREPTPEQLAEHRRAEREKRTVARMRARFAVQRAAHDIVQAEYQRWLDGR